MKILSPLVTLLALPAVLIADDPRKIDVSEGFGKAKWGMSVKELQKVVPEAKRDATATVAPHIQRNQVLSSGGAGPVEANYFLFLQDQLIAVVRTFQPKILEDTTRDAVRAALAKQFVPADGMRVTFEGVNLWDPVKPLRMNESEPPQVSRKPLTITRRSLLELVIGNDQLFGKIRIRMHEEKIEQVRAAAEKLAPDLANP